MNIGSGSGYPSSALSNFSPHPFEIDGVKVASMEGFLQALKFKDTCMQEYVCTLVGKAAKFKGKAKKWYVRQMLHWGGSDYPRHSDAYQRLLDRAYEAMFSQSESFRKALKASGRDAVFTHTIGNTDSSRTVLTRSEFCGRLMKLKDKVFSEAT